MKIKTTKTGYAADVTCHVGHGGNTGLVLSQRGWWQCQGCGNFVGQDTVLQSQIEARAIAAATAQQD